MTGVDTAPYSTTEFWNVVVHVVGRLSDSPCQLLSTSPSLHLPISIQVTSILIRVTKEVRDAPMQAQVVLNEVNEITIILDQVQSFLNGNRAINRDGASIILIEQVIVVLAGCGITFSELETVLNSLKTDGPLDTIDRIKWVRQDSTIAGFVQRLQNHKISMNVIPLEAKRSLALVSTRSKYHNRRRSQRVCGPFLCTRRTDVSEP